jgi:hypothetical protein
VSVTFPLVLLPGTHAPVRRWLGGVMTSVVCLVGVTSLVPPALAAVPTLGTASEARPSVHLEGRLTTEGLPAGSTTSVLTVVNDGRVAIAWTVHGVLHGDGASAADIAVLAPVDGECGAPGRRLEGWSPLPLAPGATTTVCVRLGMTGASAGSVTPTVTVDARAW